MENIRLCHVATDLTEPGVSDTLRTLCDLLPAANFPWQVITGPMWYPDSQAKEFIRLHPGRITVLDSISKAGTAMRAGKFDLVHTHGAGAGFWGRVAAGKACPTVHTPYGQSLQSILPGWCAGLAMPLERYASRSTGKFICLTELEKKQALAAYGLPEKKIQVIPQGISWNSPAPSQDAALQAKKELGISADDTVVAMIGRIEPSKGPRFFLEAATAVAAAEPNAKFLLVGEGTMREELEAFARRQGIEQRVAFTGWKEDITALISIIDILASPGIEENTATYILKAQAQGKAVVASDAGCAPEAISTGRTGILVQPRNVPALAQALLELIRNKGKRDFLGRQAQEQGTGKFDPSRTASMTAQVYRSLFHAT